MVDNNVAVSVAGISLKIKDNQILEDVSFDCRQGEWTLVYGASGSGKSTLLRAINGLVSIDKGRIWTLGTCIPGRPKQTAREVWRKTGTLFQEVALFETRNAIQNVELALRTVGVAPAEARAQAGQWLDRLAVGHKLSEYPARLSGGERQRVALARAFAINPRLLILDEPTSALDEDTAVIVLTAIKELAEAGAAVVMSSHRLGEVADLCHQRIAMARGRVVAMERRAPAPEQYGTSGVGWQENGQLAPHVAQEPGNNNKRLGVIGGKSIARRFWRAFQ